MAHIQGEIIISRPVEAVFDFVADEWNEPLYNQSMVRAEKVTDGPIGPGSRFSAEVTSMGRATKMMIEFTVYDRPRKLSSLTRITSMDIDGTLTFDAVGDGTRMKWSWDVKPLGALKFMAPLIWLTGKRQEERIWTGLKHYLEGQDVQTAALKA